jgi:hypothetical protein
MTDRRRALFSLDFRTLFRFNSGMQTKKEEKWLAA